MKRLMGVVLGLVVLTGCGRNELEELSGRIREVYTDNRSLSMKAAVSTDYGDRVMDFEVSCVQTEEGAISMEVLSPDLIQGVTATVSEAGASLAYDGVILELSALPGTGLSPMETLPYMLRQWSEGYQTTAGFETLDGVSCVRLSYKTGHGGVTLEQHVWFAKETLLPIVSELYIDGTMTVRCRYSNVTLGG